MVLACRLVQLLNQRPHRAPLWAALEPGGPLSRRGVAVALAARPMGELADHPSQSGIPAAVIRAR